MKQERLFQPTTDFCIYVLSGTFEIPTTDFCIYVLSGTFEIGPYQYRIFLI